MRIENIEESCHAHQSFMTKTKYKIGPLPCRNLDLKNDDHSLIHFLTPTTFSFSICCFNKALHCVTQKFNFVTQKDVLT